MRSPRNKSITAPIVSDLPLLRCETLDSVSRCDECSPHEGGSFAIASIARLCQTTERLQRRLQPFGKAGQGGLDPVLSEPIVRNAKSVLGVGATRSCGWNHI